MIKEIFCNKFINPKIHLKSGLNVILGDKYGANSIGKTSILLIIDFMLGGDDYLKKSDTIKYIGHHEIGACFQFGEQTFYFVRNTKYSQTVFEADFEYNIIKEMYIDEYRDLLQEQYKLSLYECSFRTILGQFTRIYGKENYNESKPLQLYNGEPLNLSIIRLVKLFDLYKEISDLDQNRKSIAERNKIYNKATNLNLIKIAKNKKDAEIINKRIDSLRQEIDVLTSELSTNTTNLNTQQLQQILNIKEQLYHIQEAKSSLAYKIKRYETNINSTKDDNIIDIHKLKKFFPTANILEINKINNFHNNICKIIEEDLVSQIKRERERFKILDDQEKILLDSIKSVIKEQDASKLAVHNIVNMQKEMLELIDSTSGYDNKIKYQKEKRDAENLFNETFQKVLTSIQQIVNSKIEYYCDIIYGKKKKSPLITLHPSKYSYDSPTDVGTGFRYSGLIMFDLSILYNTVLPILIHDSIILKNIEDEAIEKIMKIYASFTEKQIFIAFDKQESYSNETQKIVQQNKVLELSPGGSELFGKAWNTKSI